MSCILRLSNGAVISGCELSGSTWLTSQEVSAETFRGGLSLVKITGSAPADGEPDPRGEFRNMRLGGVFNLGAKSCFVLNEAGADEAERLRSDVDYLAMMLEVEL